MVEDNKKQPWPPPWSAHTSMREQEQSCLHDELHVACMARETASCCQCYCIPGAGPAHPLQLCTASHTCRYGLPP